MKYIKKGIDKLKIQDHKDGKILIIIENETLEIKVKNIQMIIAESDQIFKIKYRNSDNIEKWKQFKMENNAKSLANTLHMECVGCGNKHIKKVGR